MIRKLLVALDSSERADRVFGYAVGLAESLGASIHLMRAVSVPPEFPPAAHVSSGDGLPGYLMKKAEADLQAFAARAPRLRIETMVRESTQPWRAIIDAADEVDADLIVVGSHGYSGIDHLLGTNAGKVANLAARNVVVVHREIDSPQVAPYRQGRKSKRAPRT